MHGAVNSTEMVHTHFINLHHPKPQVILYLSVLVTAELLYPYSWDVQLYLLLQTSPNLEIRVWALQVLIELL